MAMAMGMEMGKVSAGFAQKTLDTRCRGLGTAAIVVVDAQAPRRVVQVAARRMVHGVVAWCVAVDFLVVDIEALGDGRPLCGPAAQPEKTGVEAGHVGFERLGGIAIGVYGHENDLQTATVFAQQLLDLCHFLQRGGADIRALCIAKKDRHHPARKIPGMARLSVVVGQRQVGRRLRPGDVNAAKLCLFSGTCTEQRQGADGYCASTYRFEGVSFQHSGHGRERSSSKAANSALRWISEKRKVLRASASE